MNLILTKKSDGNYAIKEEKIIVNYNWMGIKLSEEKYYDELASGFSTVEVAESYMKNELGFDPGEVIVAYYSNNLKQFSA